ncbi:hypothetical protein BDW59DRAFT_179516 [Aspergillus cavernicola]|uniref:O-methyltransferase C-terminal domain-containing protein n=1 Tax=Aspergillus cavernicola TaxID=176166 RepID=A0ABR4J1P8_9EURO
MQHNHPVSYAVTSVFNYPFHTEDIHRIAPLGFVPVAIHFRLFDILVEVGGPASGQDVLDIYQKSPSDSTTNGPRSANQTTRYLASTPSAIHGVLHFTTEILLSSAFLMRKLEATGFDYPFTELDIPMQYAHHLMENEKLTKLYTYAIMAAENRMASFNTFMEGRFGKEPTAPEHLKAVGYDLESVVAEARAMGLPVTMVDIGGGRGQLMREIKESIPGLESQDLIVEEFIQDITSISGLTLVEWDYTKEDNPQPIQGALFYRLASVLHNLPDLAAARLLQKMSDAMEPHSRIMIHERRKHAMADAHAAMIVLYEGREGSIDEWHLLAKLARLKLTFLGYPSGPERGAVEMRKIDWLEHILTQCARIMRQY